MAVGLIRPLETEAVHKSNAPKVNTKKQARRKLNEIYQLPLPVACYPLPTVIPHNPLSIARVIFIVIANFVSPPSSHPEIPYKAYFSAITQSVHVTDTASIRALWEKGFFGKGSLSRSDPSWLDREKKRLGLKAAATSEEHTRARRTERRQMKYERALKEREAIEDQLRQERRNEQSMHASADDIDGLIVTNTDNDATIETVPIEVALNVANSPQPYVQTVGSDKATADDEMIVQEDTAPLLDHEHLQLSLEEAFFLTYGLGVLEVYPEGSTESYTTMELLHHFRSHSYFPPAKQSHLQPDDPFLIKYVVYHHFRSLGWVVRYGNKFSVDFLLYNRGPVFSHAEFAVIVLPSYSHTFWTATEDRARRTELKQKRDWWWFHCVNRVQAHVRKTLVIVYVEIPPPDAFESVDGSMEFDIGNALKRYKVHDFVLRRWLMNRSRD